MKHTILFTLFCSIVMLSSCNSENADNEVTKEIARLKKEKKEDSYYRVHETSVYDPEYGFINRKDRLWQDMFLDPGIGRNGLSFSAYFYNYGDSIKLFNGCRNDCFIPLGHIQVMLHIDDMHSLRFNRIIEDEKYGLYAIVDWEIGNITLYDIYMTPMAYQAYRTRSGDDNLIFVQFVGDNKFMNVIFRGDYFAKEMVENHSDEISDNLFAGAENSGQGQFWHPRKSK